MMLTEPITDGPDRCNINSLHVGLENMIMLQNTCKVYGIKFYQQYYMAHAYKEIEECKDHPNLEYLYKQLDQTQRVKPAIHEYISHITSLAKSKLTVSIEDKHPNSVGHKLYFNDILLPFLEEKNFFE